MTSTKTTPEAPMAALDLAELAGEPEEVEYSEASVNVPEEVKAFVDQAHELWKTSPRKWWGKTLSTPGAVADVAKLSGKYASSTGRTFRMNRKAMKLHEDGTRLVYKVTDAVRKGGKDTANGES